MNARLGEITIELLSPSIMSGREIIKLCIWTLKQMLHMNKIDITTDPNLF